MPENLEIPDQVIEDVGRAQYLSVTRQAGLPDEIAHETYEENKDKTDKLTEFVLKKDIERGDQTRKLIQSHNKANNFGGVSGEKLRQIVDKIEKLEKEKAEVAECIRDAFGEAKSFGYDVKVLRKLIKLRKVEYSKRAEEQEILDIYMQALGMTPIEQAIAEFEQKETE